MAELEGGEGVEFSKLSKYEFFLLFASKDKTLLYIIVNMNTEVEFFFFGVVS